MNCGGANALFEQGEWSPFATSEFGDGEFIPIYFAFFIGLRTIYSGIGVINLAIAVAPLTSAPSISPTFSQAPTRTPTQAPSEGPAVSNLSGFLTTSDRPFPGISTDALVRMSVAGFGMSDGGLPFNASVSSYGVCSLLGAENGVSQQNYLVFFVDQDAGLLKMVSVQFSLLALSINAKVVEARFAESESSFCILVVFPFYK